MHNPIITDSAGLEQALEALAASEVIALDTEFMRERTYYGQLCLIQIGDGKNHYAIDPLAMDDLSALAEFLSDRKRLKVFHAGGQDLELLNQAKIGPFGPIFDTQVAAMLAGHGEQIGYARLVERICDVQLAKGQTRTDWARRPLAEKQIVYALDDVVYLPKMFAVLNELLRKGGREEWLQPDFDALEQTAVVAPEPREIWRKVKGHGKLRPVQLAILRELAAWRETQAIERNKPRGWIVKDEIMIELTRMQPEDPADIGKLRGVDERFVSRYGDTVIALIAEGKAVAADDRPRLPPKPNPALEPLVDVLMAIARGVSEQHQIALAMLTNRDTLRKLAAGDDDLALLRGWRGKLLGQQLHEFANGQSSVSVVKGRLKIDAVD